MAPEWNDWITSLYKTNYKRMCRVAYRLIGNSETAKELVQDTFLLAIFHQKELLPHPKPEVWLMLTLINLCKNERRRLSSKDISLEDLADFPAQNDKQSVEEWLPAELSEKDRTILMWRFGEELDYREIANRLGISEPGSRSRVSRAVARCRELLKNRNFPL